MYKQLAVAFGLIVFISVFTHAATYGGGSGTAEDPYQIWTPEQMNTIGLYPEDWQNYFVLMSSLNMVSYSNNQYNIIGNQTTDFTGTFDGNGHIIRNLTYTTSQKIHFIGIFGCISKATIKNLGVEGVTISSSGSFIGGLAAYSDGSIITACHVTGAVNGNNVVGGLVGYNLNSTITSCYSTCSIGGGSNHGGLVGSNLYSTLFSCYATGSVCGFTYVGGLVGDNSGFITACYAAGSVQGDTYVGGLVGGNYSQIMACYATGSPVYGKDGGGLVGLNQGVVTSCYATGAVGGGYAYQGGLVGRNQDTITSCFWNTQTSGLTKGVGFPSPDPLGVLGKTTTEMKTFSTFTSAGWDFTNETSNGTNDFWRMCTNGKDYPRLSWESIDGDFACPNGIYTEDINHYIDWWLMNDCTSINNYCSGVDLNYSGVVDLVDLTIFAANWLK
jgi:hypothetical protein